MGKVILSFDFEIGWGDITNGVWKRREANGVYKKLRHVLPEMLKTMDNCNFSATWATVGAMIERPEGRDFSHLSEKQRLVVEAGLREGQVDTFNGRDLFELVLACKTNQEIACHSFSHIPFDYDGVDGIFVKQEMRRFNEILARYELSTNKFVFPENTEAFYAELLETGYDKVRVPANNFFKSRYLYLLSLAVIPPPTSKEELDETGMTRHFGSMLFNDAGDSRRIPLLERRVSLGLRNVVQKNHDLHIWAHPFNFAESDGLLKSFKSTIEKIASLRDAGKLSIEFM